MQGGRLNIKRLIVVEFILKKNFFCGRGELPLVNSVVGVELIWVSVTVWVGVGGDIVSKRV